MPEIVAGAGYATFIKYMQLNVDIVQRVTREST